MNHTSLLTLGITLFTTIGCAAYAQDGVSIRRLVQSITVDGGLADWGAPALSPLTAA